MLHERLKLQLIELGIDADTPPDAAAWQQLLARISSEYEDIEALEDWHDAQQADTLYIPSPCDDLPGRQAAAGTAPDSALRSLQSIVSTLGGGCCVLDSAGYVQAINPEGEHLLGWRSSDLLGTSIASFIIDDSGGTTSNPLDADRLQALIARRQPYHNSDGHFARRGGALLAVSYVIYPLGADGAEPQGALLVFFSIEEHKSVEAELQKSRSHYRRVIKDIHEVIFQTNVVGMLVFLNPAWEQITGFSVEESIGTDFLSYVHPDDREHNQQLLTPLLEGVEQSCRYDIRYRTQAGGYRWVEVFAQLARDTWERPVGLSGTLRDITARRQAEETLHSRESILEAVAFAAESFLGGSDFHQSTQAVLGCLGSAAAVSRVYVFENYHTPDGSLWTSQRYEWVAPGITAEIDNPEMQQLSYEKQQILRWASILSQGGAVHGIVQSFPEHERRVLEKQDILSIVVTPIFVGQEWWGFIGFDDCLSERVWSPAEIDALKVAARIIGAAIQRQHAEHTLRESEERFRQLAENINEVFWLLSPDQRQIIYVSPAYEEIWGRSRASVYANPASRLDAIHWQEQVTVRAALEHERQSEYLIGYDQQYRVVRPDGSMRWIRDRLFPIINDLGEVYRVAGISEDITTRKEAEAAMQRARDEAEAANRAKSAFLANMSHELRTPLNAILGYSEMLHEEAEEMALAAGFREDLSRIYRAGSHLLSVINDVLDISKIEAGKMDIYPASFEIAPLIQQVMHTLQPLILKNKNTCFIQHAPDIGSMHTDEMRVRQVLYNLLSNAAKFTTAGTITLNVRREERVIVLDAEDDAENAADATACTDGSLNLYADTPADHNGTAPVVSSQTTRVESWVYFHISDTGMGISPELMPKLFQAFTQANSSTSRSHEGTGLGLTISRRLCRLMGGDITVSSEPGRGTTFTMALPAHLDSEEHAHQR